MKVSDDVLKQARATIAAQLGLDFGGSQTVRFERGLAEALRAAAIPAGGAASYWQGLGSRADAQAELMRIARYFTVGETYFFRDAACFGALRETVLPALIARQRKRPHFPVRIWSAGCSTGEEPYSLAIVLDQLLADDASVPVDIVATDVDASALATARRGRYREWSLRETPSWIRSRYFAPAGPGRYELNPRIRRMVTFIPDNLASGAAPPGIGERDLILCRNVLMYFTPDAAERVIARLIAALAPDGWLATSPTEAAAEWFEPLSPVNFTGAILFRREPAAPALRDQAGSAVQHILRWPDEPLAAVADPGNIPDDRTKAETPAVPAESGGWLARARALANQGRLADARRECEAWLAANALNPEGYLLLAAITQEEGDVPTSLEALRRALYLDPDAAWAHFLMGGLWFREGDRNRGQRAMENAARLLAAMDPDRAVPGANEVTARDLLQAANAYLNGEAEEMP
ncbi:MAG: hypothetical protein M0Z53_02210 [Thermaerobacter sp.]|nr:hypothetical protein [Thermaerobacter sp.]